MHTARQLGFAVEQRARVERREQPFVRIDDEGVDAFDACELCPRAGDAQRRAAVCRVDVEPQPARRGDGGETGEIVDDAGVRRSRGRRDRAHRIGFGVRGQGALERRAREPIRVVGLDDERVAIEDPQRARDRRMRLLADRDPPAVGATTAARRRRLAGDHERRQVSGRTTRDETSARGRREPGEVGEEPQRLVLGVDRARRLQPRRRVDRRRRDDRVEHERGLGRRGRDEREEPRAVGRDAGGREDLGEHPEHGFGVTAFGRDRPPRTRRELVVGAGVVERRGVEPEPLERVIEARPRRALGCLVEVVHADA